MNYEVVKQEMHWNHVVVVASAFAVSIGVKDQPLFVPVVPATYLFVRSLDAKKVRF